jgi:hypothetical protein
MAFGHIGGMPVEETLPALVAPIAVYLAAGGIAFRAARKRWMSGVPAKGRRRRQGR